MEESTSADLVELARRSVEPEDLEAAQARAAAERLAEERR
jgi:hypothetical protein